MRDLRKVNDPIGASNLPAAVKKLPSDFAAWRHRFTRGQGHRAIVDFSRFYRIRARWLQCLSRLAGAGGPKGRAGARRSLECEPAKHSEVSLSPDRKAHSSQDKQPPHLSLRDIFLRRRARVRSRVAVACSIAHCAMLHSSLITRNYYFFPSHFRTHSVSFWPPKPAELFRHTSIPPLLRKSRATLGT